jgi:hypothetical protein
MEVLPLMSDQPIPVISDADQARMMNQFAAEVTAEDATTYTGDGVFEALSRLAEVLAQKVLDAAYIRGGRPKRRRNGSS